MRDYHPLPAHPLAPDGACALVQPTAARVTIDSPALEVMTDLLLVPAVSIERDASIDATHAFMIARGVRSLFVLGRDGRVQGLVTATDLLGERPLRVSEAQGIRRGELTAADVMTPLASVVAFRLHEIMTAKVGHIVASLKASGRHHALVSERVEGAGQRIRGIFSATQIARQLGEPVHIAEVANTFAEVEQALGR